MTASLVVGLLVAPLIARALLPQLGDCAVLSTFGHPCPGCGVGRALTALFALDLGGAMLAYPPLLALIAGYGLGIAALIQRLRGRSIAHWSRLAHVSGVGISAIVLGNWIVHIWV